MAGIAIILDLLKKNPKFYSTHTLHCFGSFSAKVAMSGAAAFAAASYPFGFRAFLGSNKKIAHCDSAATWSDDYVSKDPNVHISKDCDIPGYVLESDSLGHLGKVYDIELKPLLSAFRPRTFAITTLRSFLMYYLPLLEPRTTLEEDDGDFLADKPEENRVDLITPFHKSIKQILRESTVVTTRRVLERLAVSYFSQKMAWKLLKDAPKSAMRKAQRGMPTTIYIYAVGRTTLRVHFLGVAASWIVQVGVEIYRTLCRLFNPKEELDQPHKMVEFEILGRKVFGVTVRCSASLVFAAIGAGIGATLSHPSLGQWVGCALGDLAGPIIIAVCFDKFLHSKA
ncbi:hypothetical protein Cgig2_028512 [Carnegiea gigantea]|uniref:Uncharacterized protein n=1 Tax=Carnegiea gigantea TaxID=171969 RepID=A0A9Q1JJ39_9CARY|nr:hypothetical protein Cgig2_028512 [Carnegiea gigantea]